MQVSYYFALTKIQKLQNFKKKKDFFCAGQQCLKLADMAGTWSVRPVFKPVQNIGTSILVYISIRYIS